MAVLIPGVEKAKQKKHRKIPKQTSPSPTKIYRNIKIHKNQKDARKNSAMTPEEEKILNK